MKFMKKSDVGKKYKKDVEKNNNENKKLKKLSKNEISKKEFLILELHHFVKENGRVPTQLDMQPKNGYPSSGAYQNHFGSWNKALKTAGLKVNQPTNDGTETCSHCGKRADEIHNHIGWYYHDGVRYCMKHGHKGTGRIPDYVKGELDINSETGRGRAGEICVIKALKIGNEYDCNRLSCGYSFDMYNDEYDKIDVKTSVLSNDYNKWIFKFNAKKIADTYICIGMSLDTKNVEHVWIVPNVDEIRNLIIFQVYDTYGSLLNRRQWKVDPKNYDEAWKEMLNNYTDGKCKIFSKKGD